MDFQHIQLVMHSYCTFLIALFTFNTVVHTLLHTYARLLTTSFIMFRLLHSKTLWVNDFFFFFAQSVHNTHLHIVKAARTSFERF